MRGDLPDERVCAADILDVLETRGMAFLLFVFALPAALPIPGLGINTIIATPLFFLTVQQMLGHKSVWLPKKIKGKCFSRSFFDKMIDKAIPLIKKVEWFLRPRFTFMTEGFSTKIVGLIGLIMAASITIPLPFTNTVPAMGIALMALGVVMCDGIAVLAGAILGLIWVSGLVYISIFLGAEGFEFIKETLKSLF